VIAGMCMAFSLQESFRGARSANPESRLLPLDSGFAR